MTGWLLVGWLAAALLATPLRLEAAAGITEQLSGQACLHIWGVPVRWSFRTSQADGRLHMLVRGCRVEAPEHPAPPVDASRAQVVLGTLLRTDHARKLLRQGIHLQRLHVQALLALQDAGKTAVLCGMLNLLNGLLPRRVVLNVQPDFWSSHSAFTLNLALETRLAVLVEAAVLTAVAWLDETMEKHRKREEK